MKHQFKKKFGQNFLKDENLLKKIVNHANINGERVIEIGPGAGALTKQLLEVASEIIAFEIDTSLEEHLNKLTKNNKHLKIIYKDILEVDLNEFEEPYHVIGNIPYHITTPIIFKLSEANNIKSITLMMQEEVGNRISAKPNTKEYNALSVILQHQYYIEKIVKVNRKMFYPIPNVDSIVLKFTPKSDVDIDFIQFVKACFKQKRKTLANNLYDQRNIPKETTYDILKTLGLSVNSRAEALNLHNFIDIAKEIKTK